MYVEGEAETGIFRPRGTVGLSLIRFCTVKLDQAYAGESRRLQTDEKYRVLCL